MVLTVDEIRHELRELGHQVEMTPEAFERGKERMMAAVQRRALVQAARDYESALDGGADVYELQAKRAAFQQAHHAVHEVSVWNAMAEEAARRVLSEEDGDE